MPQLVFPCFQLQVRQVQEAGIRNQESVNKKKKQGANSSCTQLLQTVRTGSRTGGKGEHYMKDKILNKHTLQTVQNSHVSYVPTRTY